MTVLSEPSGMQTLQLGRYQRLWVVVILIASLVGCVPAARTQIASQIASQTNPDFKGQRYLVIMAHAEFSDLGIRQRAEDRLCAIVHQSGAVCVPAHETFFPGKEYSADEILRTLGSRGVQAVLVVSAEDGGVETSYIPPAAEYGRNRGVGGFFDIPRAVAESRTRCRRGGYDLQNPWAEFKAQLFDVVKRDVAWVAIAHSGGKACSLADSVAALVDAMAANVAGDLVKSGLLQKNAN